MAGSDMENACARAALFRMQSCLYQMHNVHAKFQRKNTYNRWFLNGIGKGNLCNI